MYAICRYNCTSILLRCNCIRYRYLFCRGHNGVRSVHDVLQTQEVSRLLIGIDRPAHRDDVADYVLTKFTNEERKIVSKVTDEALCMLAKQIEKQTEVDSQLITSQIRDSAVEPES